MINFLQFLILFSFLHFSFASFEESKEEENDQFEGGNILCKFIETIFAFSQKQNSPKSQNNYFHQNHSNLEAYKGVIGLVSQRLDLAQPVALYKWQNNQSIDDPLREAALLANVASQANVTGLSAQFAQKFFQAQINASKIVQFAYFAFWEANGAPNVTAPDLATVTRPLINNVTLALVNALGPVEKIRGDRNCQIEVAIGTRELAGAKQIYTNPEGQRAEAMCVGLGNLCGK